jgi:HUS1 checkpoint protein
MRTIVERLRPMSDILAFQANNNKRLVVAIKTESVYAQTEWTDCQNPKSACLSSFHSSDYLLDYHR